MPYQPLLFDSPQISYLNTPASSFVSPPAFTVSLCDVGRPKQHLHNSISVTLTANSLSSMIIQSRTKNTQLLAPQSPSHQSSPIPPPSPGSPASTSSGRPDSDSSVPWPHTHGSQSDSNLILIPGFVREVLKLSCTSRSVLQTALCYLEAIRTNFPELACREAIGEGVMGEVEIGDRIVPVEIEHPIAMIVDSDTLSDLNSELFPKGREPLDSPPIPGLPPQQQQHQTQQQCCQALPQWPQDHSRKPKSPGPPLPLFPCPHRAFLAFLILASLILASKFTQDKCYSNRAWVKLSSLLPRKIERCERALGGALEWWLWVGKSPPSPSPSSVQQLVLTGAMASAPLSAQKSNGHLRTVVRSHSDGDLYAGSKSAARRHQHQHQHQAIGMWTTCTHLPSYILHGPTRSGLAWSTTLPEGALGTYPPLIHPKNDLNWTVTLPSMHTHAQPSVDGSFDSIMGFEPRGPLGGTTTYTATTNTITDPETLCSSPNMATPTLTFSPSSTESSSGDRAIQMTSFIDKPTSSFSTAAPFGPGLKTGNGNGNATATAVDASLAPMSIARFCCRCLFHHFLWETTHVIWQPYTMVAAYYASANPVIVPGTDRVGHVYIVVCLFYDFLTPSLPYQSHV
jgi:hypothetical protein